MLCCAVSKSPPCFVPCALCLVPHTKWSPFRCLLSSSQGNTMSAGCPVPANQLKPTNEGKLLVTFTHNKAGLHTRVKHRTGKQGTQIVSLHLWVWLTSASLCFHHSVLPLKTCFLCPRTCKPGRLIIKIMKPKLQDLSLAEPLPNTYSISYSILSVCMCMCVRVGLSTRVRTCAPRGPLWCICFWSQNLVLPMTHVLP